MEKDTEVVTHEGTSLDTCIFYKRGYGETNYNTLSIGYQLPSLNGKPHGPVGTHHMTHKMTK